MNKKKMVKTSILFVLLITMVVYACRDKKENNDPVITNSVIMKFNGTEWNTMINAGSQNTNSISVGAFNDAGVSAESFFLQFKKSAITQGNTYDATVLDTYQIQHNGSNYTITSASFKINVLTSNRFELEFSMILSSGATIDNGTIKVNI